MRALAPLLEMLFFAPAVSAWIEAPEQTHHAPQGSIETLSDMAVVEVHTIHDAGAYADLIRHDPKVCIDTKEILERFGGLCAARAEDAWATCARLDGCVAVQCLPEDASFQDDEELRSAAALGDSSKVQWLLERGYYDLDQRDGRGRTMLMMAAMSGSIETVEILLRSGASSTLVDSQGLSALDLAKSDKFFTGSESQRSAIVFELDRAVHQQQIASTRFENAKQSGEGDVPSAAICLFSSSLDDRKSNQGREIFCEPSETTTLPLSSIPPGNDAKRHPRCTRHQMKATALADAIDLDSLPSSAARHISNARREHRTVFAYDQPPSNAKWAKNLKNFANGNSSPSTTEMTTASRHLSVVDGFAAPLVSYRTLQQGN